MKNLQRVPIVDKNGKATTVHRKSTTPIPATRSLVKPTVQQKESRKDAIIKLADDLHQTVYGNGFDVERFDLSDFRASLTGYSDETINKITEFFADHSSGFRYNGGMHHSVASMIEDGATESLVNNLVTYMPRFTQLTIVAYSYYQESGSIDWELEESKDGLMLALEETASSLEFISRPTAVIVGKHTNWGAPVIKDPRIVKLVLDRLEDNDRINNIIIERQSADYDVLMSVLDEPTKALSKGVL